MTRISKLRTQILGRRQIAFKKHTKQLIPVKDLPDTYPKTPKMKYLETKYDCKIESIIFRRSLNDSVAAFNYEVDRATVSRWRKYAQRYLGDIPVKVSTIYAKE